MGQYLEWQPLEGQSLEQQSLEGQPLEQQSLEGQHSEGQPVEGQHSEKQSISRAVLHNRCRAVCSSTHIFAPLLVAAGLDPQVKPSHRAILSTAQKGPRFVGDHNQLKVNQTSFVISLCNTEQISFHC